ncbi:MAG TPA: polysaccharide biosynthesis/export family protein [Kofleriaceae bacterium]|nr:polysaccharide biosynthesis/export family protein [Kofleriaceae bacterium]
MRPVLTLAFVALTALVALAGCPAKVPFYDYKQLEQDPYSKELVLGVGDSIAINVWENKEFNTEATIRSDGKITMPLIGDLQAAGETPSALKAQIKARLADYVKSAPGTELVTIAVKAWKSYKFTIQGEVQRQGVFTSESFVRFAEAIAMAGGLTRFAKESQIKIFRLDPKTKKTKEIPLDYGQITSGKRLDMNVWILPGDVISVP